MELYHLPFFVTYRNLFGNAAGSSGICKELSKLARYVLNQCYFTSNYLRVNSTQLSKNLVIISSVSEEISTYSRR